MINNSIYLNTYLRNIHIFILHRSKNRQFQYFLRGAFRETQKLKSFIWSGKRKLAGRGMCVPEGERKHNHCTDLMCSTQRNGHDLQQRPDAEPNLRENGQNQQAA